MIIRTPRIMLAQYAADYGRAIAQAKELRKEKKYYEAGLVACNAIVSLENYYKCQAIIEEQCQKAEISGMFVTNTRTGVYLIEQIN